MVLIVMALGVLVIAGSQSDRPALNSNHSPPTSKYPPLCSNCCALRFSQFWTSAVHYHTLLQFVALLFPVCCSFVFGAQCRSSRMAWQMALLSVLFKASRTPCFLRASTPQKSPRLIWQQKLSEDFIWLSLMIMMIVNSSVRSSMRRHCLF